MCVYRILCHIRYIFLCSSRSFSSLLFSLKYVKIASTKNILRFHLFQALGWSEMDRWTIRNAYRSYEFCNVSYVCLYNYVIKKFSMDSFPESNYLRATRNWAKNKSKREFRSLLWLQRCFNGILSYFPAYVLSVCLCCTLTFAPLNAFNAQQDKTDTIYLYRT